MEENEIDENEIDDNNIIKKKLYKTIRGKTLKRTNKYEQKEITFENLIQLVENDFIRIPDFQRDINHTKVESMIQSYNEDSECFNYITNPIQIIKLIDNDIENYYLIDGQHRYYMYKKLSQDNRYGELIINIINCNSTNEMLLIYQKLNKDNLHILMNKFSVTEIDNWQLQSKYYIFKNDLYKHFKTCWKKDNKQIYDLEEYICLLKDINYLEEFDTITTAISHIIKLNNHFIDEYKNINLDKLTKPEIELIEQKKIFTLRNNNFISALIEEEITPTNFKFLTTKHIIKKKNKTKIITK
jgi:hypothetical protein